MKRSTFITWDQLKVGVLVLVALAILTVAIFQLGEAANLFAKRYELTIYLANSNGLRVGGQVTVAGQLAGAVKSIDFLPVDNDTTKNIKAILSIDTQLMEQIREDSRGKVRTMGLLGDKTVDITPGTPQFRALKAGETLILNPSLDYEQVIQQAAGAVDDMVGLTHDLRQITGRLVEGEGTMGRFLTDTVLYDRMTIMLGETSSLLQRLQRPNGTFGKMIDDSTLYIRMVGVTGALDTLMRTVSNPNGTFGRLMTNDTLYTRLMSITASIDSTVKLLHSGNGFAARMLTDQQLYDRLNKLITDFGAIAEDVRRNPGKYTKGMIKVF